MSSDPEPHLVTRISQLEQQQVQLKKYLATLKRRLDEQTQQFNSRPEPQQLAELQKRLDELCENRVNISPSPETDIPISVDIIPTTPLLETEVILSPPKSELVFDRSGSRSVLLEALETAEERLIIVCPWLNCNSINDNLLQKMRDCLNRNCQIDIGWGYLGDRSKIGKGWRYNALGDLQQLEQEYPDLFRLKLLGTHEKYIVCDFSFAMVGSHNVLTSGVQSAEREVGIKTTDFQIIQGLINRFDESEETEKSEIVQRFSDNITQLDEAEYLEGIVETEDFDEDDEDEDVEESQEPPVTAEEFLRRYNEGERDFTGINLAGVDLSSTGESLGSDVNLSKANLRGANLRYMHLGKINLTGANLRESDLSGAYLVKTKLDRVNLKNADLSKADLREASFKNAKLNNVNMSEANISDADLSGANLSQADLYKAYLHCSKLIYTRLNGAELSDAVLTVTNCKNAEFTNARLVNADLRGAKFRNANFKEANFHRANLRGNYHNQQILVDLINVNFENTNLEQAICDENTRFPVDFDFLRRGVYLIAPGVSLSNADLSTIDLSYTNLKGAQLKGVQLQEACIIYAQLSYTDLSQAKLNGTDLRNTCLAASKLVEADLREAKLESANLSGADLNSADLRSSQLNYTDLSGADLTNAKLDGADLNNAILKGATMPDGTVHE
ncbi:MAG: pentapeptide repeat-containing protein [Lyngbya sp.]|nr:pentapeptide repeat-containing protein [Lyngbya sp.]